MKALAMLTKLIQLVIRLEEKLVNFRYMRNKKRVAKKRALIVAYRNLQQDAQLRISRLEAEANELERTSMAEWNAALVYLENLEDDVVDFRINIQEK